MSMLDGFFNKGFKGARCKTLLKLTIPRIKLLRNRRVNQLRLMRRDIAKLLENGQEATARIRVEHIIREENINAAQEIIELFCELVAVRLPIIETQRECPIDLKEAISSICFAAPRSADLPELQQVQMLFAAKYGKEFVAAASELMPDCGVNRQIIELLSVRAPSAEAKLKLLKEIAEEHELDWDPAASETELFKPHDDLLNGPNHFVSGSTLPLPKEKLDDYRRKESDEESDTDVGLDSLDLPEVPRVSVRPSSDTAPEIHPHHPSEPDREVTMSPPHKDSSRIPDVEPTPDGSDPLPYLYTPDAPFQVREHKHSVHFSPSPSPDSLPSQMKQSDSENSSDLPSVPSISPTVSWENCFAGVDAPPMPAVSFSPKHDMPDVPAVSWKNSFAGVDAPPMPAVSFSPKHDMPGVPAVSFSYKHDMSDMPAHIPPQAPAVSFSHKHDMPDMPAHIPPQGPAVSFSPKHDMSGMPAHIPPQGPAVSFSPKHDMSGMPAHDTLQSKSSVNSDLQDVLAAAHAAADSAERAAAAARAAASLAQVRITELISKRSNIASDEGENKSLDHGDALFDQQNSFNHGKQIPDYEPAWSSGSPTLDVPEHQSPHQPERLPSLEDDPYYSYPNLFSSQGGERQIR